jgi:LEM3 (ligand-effect modulator 3) family / CDC50 family
MELENKPKDTPFWQNRIPSWSYKLTSKLYAIIYLGFGIFFIIIGVVAILASNSVIEYKKRYDNVSECKIGSSCVVSFNVTDHMDGPVLVYYELTNMYQNHRVYAGSLSINQLGGQDLGTSDISATCSPITEVKDLDQIVPAGLAQDSTANPCGLVANTYFNDSYASGSLKIDETGIAFESDVENKFKKSSNPNLNWTDVTNGKL